MIEPKVTTVRYRRNAKYPWLLKQGHNEVKLTNEQLTMLMPTCFAAVLPGVPCVNLTG
jgi:hypothetical protein